MSAVGSTAKMFEDKKLARNVCLHIAFIDKARMAEFGEHILNNEMPEKKTIDDAISACDAETEKIFMKDSTLNCPIEVGIFAGADSLMRTEDKVFGYASWRKIGAVNFIKFNQLVANELSHRDWRDFWLHCQVSQS